MIRTSLTHLSARSPALLATSRQQYAFVAARTFTSTQFRTEENKGVLGAAKDTLKSVDRAVSDVAVKGIETGEQVASSTKQAVGDITGNVAAKTSGAHGAAAGDVKNATGQAEGKVNELAGQAKGKAAEVSGQVKGKAQEVKGQVQGEVNKL